MMYTTLTPNFIATRLIYLLEELHARLFLLLVTKEVLMILEVLYLESLLELSRNVNPKYSYLKMFRDCYSMTTVKHGMSFTILLRIIADMMFIINY